MAGICEEEEKGNIISSDAICNLSETYERASLHLRYEVMIKEPYRKLIGKVM